LVNDAIDVKNRKKKKNIIINNNNKRTDSEKQAGEREKEKQTEQGHGPEGGIRRSYSDSQGLCRQDGLKPISETLVRYVRLISSSQQTPSP
jgi:hypothetical protein